MNPDWFRPRLIELRAAAGWTQARLAERSGVTRESIAQLETGRRRPAWATVLALAAALGVRCDAFAKEPTTTPPGPARRGRPKKRPGHAHQAKRGRPSEGRPRSPGWFRWRLRELRAAAGLTQAQLAE